MNVLRPARTADRDPSEVEMSTACLGMPILREKRTAQLKSHVPQSLRELYEQFVAEDPRLTISDYVYGVLEDHAATRIAKQNIGRRGAAS